MTRSNPIPTADSKKVLKEDADALREIYADRGQPHQIERAIDFLHVVRKLGYWIACDCRADEDIYPLTSPAFLTTSATYYLKRLTGENRPNHAENCIFIFDRPFPRTTPKPGMHETPMIAPSGFFSAITPEPARNVAAKSTDASDHEDRTLRKPRLARLLLKLLAVASCNTWKPISQSTQPSMQKEFLSLRTASENIDVNEQSALARIIGFHPNDYHSNRLFARIREANKSWKKDEPPQGFLCLYTPQIKGQKLIFNKDPDIEILGEFARPREGDVAARAPYLTLIVVGEAGGRAGLAPLRAYAQPIYSPSQFLPVDSGFEREVVKLVNSVRWSLSKRAPHIDIELFKPVFDEKGADGLYCRPDIILKIIDHKTGEVRNIVIEAMGRPEDPDYIAAKEVTHPRMAHIGDIFEITPNDLNDMDRIKKDLRSFIAG